MDKVQKNNFKHYNAPSSEIFKYEQIMHANTLV
jgi:hypothetical protein